MKFLVLPMLVCFYLKTVVSLDCYWNSECKYKYFSSKTPYENVRGDIRDSIVKWEGCEPISVWDIIRHGQRNPGLKFLQDIETVVNFKDDIISSYYNGNSSLCAQDVDNLRDWKIDRSFFEEPNKITYEGYQELLGIGSRLREALPELLNDLQKEDYLFRPTFGPRTLSSAAAFIEGLKHKNLLIEQAKQNSSIANMKERIERKLGLNFTLTHKNIIAIYDVCRYTWEGIANKPSPWCAVFSVEDLKVLEYIGDLEHYSRNGYGVSQYSNIFGQITLADLLRNFQQAKNGKGKKIVSYFTHSTMMDMLLVALNLYKDTSPLTGVHRNLNRKWRSTFISTFGVNLIAVLNRCKQSGKNEYDHNIAFYWNEKPLLELCKQGVCSWQELQDKFKPFLNASMDFCELDSMLLD